MRRIAIVGSGHLGQQVAYHIQQDTKDIIIGFFDEFQEVGTIVKGLPILGGNNDIVPQFDNNIYDALVIAIGYKHMAFRCELFNQLKYKIPFYTYIHSSTILDDSAKIGVGTVIYPGCLIDQNVVIGDNVLMNVGGTIAHDSKIGDNTFVSPRVAIAGFVNIASNCIIGINVTIIDNMSIAANTQLGGGTVLIKNIETPGLYVGNPARFVR